MPAAVKKHVGFALRAAQEGQKHEDAEPLKGFKGAGVLEIITNFQTDTYRSIYTVRLVTAIYVLHVFMKKSTQGIATPEREIDLIKARLKRARELDAEALKKNVKPNKEEKLMSDKTDYEVSCGNVFADLGLPDADLLLEKSRIVLSLTRAIKEKGWTYPQAAEILGIQPPDFSDLVRGEWEDFSIERLMRFSALIDDVVQNEELTQPQNDLIPT